MGRITSRLVPTLVSSVALATGIAGILCARSEAASGGIAPEAKATSPTPTATPEIPAAGTPSTGATDAEGAAGASASDTPKPEPKAVVSAGPIALQSKSAATLGQTLSFTGQAPTSAAGMTAAIERYEKSKESWAIAAETTIATTGAFVVHWQTDVSGRLTVRAVVLTPSELAAAAAPTATATSQAGLELPAEISAAITSGSTEVTVYKPATATYYGPGFYGNRTACGQTMTTALLGLANRTLPCGTLVAVSYRGTLLTLPVIDRGPYANGAEWDLTSGAAVALGITTTVRIGTLVVGKDTNRPALGTPLSPEITPEVALTGGALAG